MSGTVQWGLVRAPDGGIMGVHSLRTDVAAKKQANFPPPLEGLEGKGRTSEWEFSYVPK